MPTKYTGRVEKKKEWRKYMWPYKTGKKIIRNHMDRWTGRRRHHEAGNSSMDHVTVSTINVKESEKNEQVIFTVLYHFVKFHFEGHSLSDSSMNWAVIDKLLHSKYTGSRLQRVSLFTKTCSLEVVLIVTDFFSID